MIVEAGAKIDLTKVRIVNDFVPNTRQFRVFRF